MKRRLGILYYLAYVRGLVLEKFVIQGGKPLRGSVTIGGAKNAAVAILPATVLAKGICIIDNLPEISDVSASAHILKELGATVKVINKNCIEIDTSTVRITTVSDSLSRQMRASYYFLGSLLGAYGEASVAMPGGCDLGSRPIDQHIKAFTSLGAETGIEAGYVKLSATQLGCEDGTHIFFDTASVGATINAMLSACLAKGTTILENVAKEPHIVDVANFLNTMGADVRGAGTDVIKIHGVSSMHGCEYAIIPDQIEAGTYMAAAVATGGDILLNNIIPKHLEPITDKFEKMGATIEVFDDSLRISRTGELEPVNIKTMPHPGFPTDLQPIISVALCLAKGTSIITEGIWDNRFRYVDELQRMSANIKVDGRVAVIEGISAFTPAPVSATDLRAGAALVVAALSTQGVSEIDEVEHIERGYENIVEKLSALGADIKRVYQPTKVKKLAF